MYKITTSLLLSAFIYAHSKMLILQRSNIYWHNFLFLSKCFDAWVNLNASSVFESLAVSLAHEWNIFSYIVSFLIL